MNATTERDHFLFRRLVPRVAAWVVAVGLMLGVAGAIAVRMAQAQQPSDDATQVAPVDALQIPSARTTLDELAPEVTVHDPATPRTVATADWEPPQPPVSEFAQIVQPNEIGRYPYRVIPIPTADPGDARVNALVGELRGVAPDLRDRGKLDELRQLIDDQFGVRHAEQQQRLEKILADAQQTEEMLQQRMEHKEQIVERRLSELLGERDPLNWDYQEPRSPPPRYTPTYPRPAQSNQAASIFTVPNVFVPQPAHIPAPRQASAPPSTTKPLLPGTSESPLASVLDDRTSAAPQPSPEDFVTALRGVSPAQSPSAEDDIVRAAFAVQNAKIALEEGKKLFDSNALSRSEFSRLQQALKEAEARWDFRRKQLQSDVELAKIEFESAKQQLHSLEREIEIVEEMVRSGKEKVIEVISIRREEKKAQLQLQVAEINFRKVVEQFEWATAFQKDLDLKADEQ